MQETVRTEIAHSEEAPARKAPRAAGQAKRRLERRRRHLAVLTLILSDVLLAVLARGAAVFAQGLLLDGQGAGVSAAGALPVVAVWVGLRALLGLYPGYGLDQVEELRRQTCAGLVALALVVAFASSGDGGLLSGWPVAVGFAGLLLFSPIARYLVKRALLKAELWGKPVTVFGYQDTGAALLQTLKKEWQLGFKPAVVFDDNPSRSSDGSGSELFAKTLAEAVGVSKERGIDTIIFTMPYTRREDLARLVEIASTSFRYVIVMPNLVGITNTAVVARDFAGSFGVEIRHNLLDLWAQRTKRVLDLLATVLGGLLISPLLVAMVIAVKLDSPGPAFYGHRRVGAGGRHFRCWKFRTMHTNAEQRLDTYLQGNPDLRVEWEQNFKLRDDPRVTRFGRFLRKTSLDELPQLFNVVLGEMSLVGPRPIVDAEIPKYGAVYETYRRIKPGISGLWQVSGRSDTGYAERVKLDAYYVRNWSVWLDLVILCRTVRCVVLGRGAY